MENEVKKQKSEWDEMVEKYSDSEKQEEIKKACDIVEKYLQHRVKDSLSGEELQYVLSEVQFARKVLIENDVDLLIDLYHKYRDENQSDILKLQVEQRDNQKKQGIIKKVKETFGLIGGIFSLVGLLCSFVCLGASGVASSNLDDADKIYKGWLSSSDGVAIVETLSEEYLQDLKEGKISYEEYQDKIANINSRENIQKYVSLPSAEPYLKKAETAHNVQTGAEIGVAGAVGISVAGLIGKGVCAGVEKKKKRKGSNLYDEIYSKNQLKSEMKDWLEGIEEKE